VRNHRHDALKKLKQQKDDKEISEDEHSSEEKDVQSKVDEANKSIDEVCKKKEQEVLTV